MTGAAQLHLRESSHFSGLKDLRSGRLSSSRRADVLLPRAVAPFAADADILADRARTLLIVGGSVAAEALADVGDRANAPQAVARRRRAVLRIAWCKVEPGKGGVPAQAALDEVASCLPAHGRDALHSAPESPIQRERALFLAFDCDDPRLGIS